MGAYKDYCGQLPRSEDSKAYTARWWNRACVLADSTGEVANERHLTSDLALNWLTKVQLDVKAEEGFIPYAAQGRLKQVGDYVDIWMSVNNIYLGRFKWKAPVTPPVTPTLCPRGDMYSPLPFQSCDPGYTSKFDWRVLGYRCFCDINGAGPPVEPPVEPPVTPPVTPPTPTPCPRGSIYTRGLFEECDLGYYQGDLPGWGVVGKGMACICAEDYVPPHEEEGLGQLFAYIPALIIAAVAIAALGLFRK